jgi:excinuclease UvrABC nuclease subunit
VVLSDIESRPDQLMSVASLLKIGVLEALAKGVTADGLADALESTFQEVRQIAAVAQDRLDAARADLAREREAHARAMEEERAAHHRTRERASERIATKITDIAADNIDGDFDPRGFFVYFLWGNETDRPLYVGKSTNILSRLGTHLTDPVKRWQITRVTLLKCETAQRMDHTESRMIRHYQPPLNKAGIVYA